MRRLTALVVIAALGVAVEAGSQGIVTCAPVPQATLDANKQLLIDFFESGRSMTREERSRRFQADDYIQHNPRALRMDEFTGATGREAWVKAFDEAARRKVALVDLGGIALRDPIIVMAECDLVTAIYKGVLKDPDDPSRTYEAFAFETVRSISPRSEIRGTSGFARYGVFTQRLRYQTARPRSRRTPWSIPSPRNQCGETPVFGLGA